VPKLVGGIGVFFPGEEGYATFEQNFVPGVDQTTTQRMNAPLAIEAEYTAALISSNTMVVGGIAPVAGVGLPNLPGGGRIDQTPRRAVILKGAKLSRSELRPT
jgi:hypothetical protein